MKYEKMTPADLKTGMIVTNRRGYEYMVYRDCDFMFDAEPCCDVLVNLNHNTSWERIDIFRQNFTHPWDRAYDIVKVERTYHPRNLLNVNFKNAHTGAQREVIWEEPKVKLTVADIEKKLGYKIEVVAEEE